MPGQETAFVATGTAVDQGLLCSEGDLTHVQTLHADTGLSELEEPDIREGEVLWVEVRLTCSDGTGDFVLRTEATVAGAELEAVVQSGELSGGEPVSVISGTEDYEGVEVVGVRQWAVGTPGGFEGGLYEVYSGTLTRS